MDLLETASKYFICTQDNFKVNRNQVNFTLQTVRYRVLICGSNDIYRGLVTIDKQIVYSVSIESRMNFNAACILVYAYLKSLHESIESGLVIGNNCAICVNRDV
jgi:hypothetical protein